MFPVNITRQDPFSLVLVNDPQLSNEKVSFDNTWEIQYEGGELGGISLYSTLGLQASSLRITPVFSNLNQSRINLKQFHQLPIITEILPNYANITVEVFSGIQYQLEYFVSNSDCIKGQVSISNTSSQIFAGELQFYVSLKPLSAGDQIKGTQIDSNYFLEGKTKDLFPVFSMGGHAHAGKMGQLSIARDFEIEPDATQLIPWMLAFDRERNNSYKRILEYYSSDFDKEATRNKLSLQRDLIFFNTGNSDWDKALLASQNSAKQLMIGNAENKRKSFLVQSRHPEKTLFHSDSRNGHPNEGVTPIQLWYFMQVLPKEMHFIQTVFDEYLDRQRSDGFIPNHLNPSNFLARSHAFPIVANIATKILDVQGSSDQAKFYLERIIPYLQYWLKISPERSGPHWETALQSLYEDFPIHNLWDKDGYGINARWIESPFLNSLLALECEKCLQIADRFEINISERPWLEDQKKNLLKNIEDSWNIKQKYYAYRDIQTKKTPGKILILKSNGAGNYQLDKQLRYPQRLNIRVVTEPDLSRKVTIEIRGVHKNDEFLETISPRNFTWGTTTGISTTNNIFDNITAINILGIPKESLVEITTSPFSTVDLSMFMPIINRGINQKRLEQMINRWLEREFLDEFGLPLVPKKYQGHRKSHLNWVDFPLNTLLLEGLIDHQQFDLAKNIFSHLMKAVIKNLRSSKNFFKLYDANSGTCSGEYNIINGMIPLRVFLRLLGIHQWTDGEIEFMGSSVFKNEIRIFYRGLSIICSQKGHIIITSTGNKIELKTRNYQKIKIPS
jgi:hypothetical protein